MTEREPGPLMDRIRAHARAQVARTSLRKVAKSAGVKVGATKKFIDGSVPYERNARLWKRWYSREVREGRAETPDESLPTLDARVALDVLLWPLSDEEREAAVPRAAAALRDLLVQLGHRPPRWTVDLAGGGPDGADGGGGTG